MNSKRVTMAVSNSIGRPLSNFVAADDEREHETHRRKTEEDQGRDPDTEIHNALRNGKRNPWNTSHCNGYASGRTKPQLCHWQEVVACVPSYGTACHVHCARNHSDVVANCTNR